MVIIYVMMVATIYFTTVGQYQRNYKLLEVDIYITQTFIPEIIEGGVVKVECTDEGHQSWQSLNCVLRSRASKIIKGLTLPFTGVGLSVSHPP